jgi:hypothetical protein
MHKLFDHAIVLRFYVGTVAVKWYTMLIVLVHHVMLKLQELGCVVWNRSWELVPSN